MTLSRCQFLSNVLVQGDGSDYNSLVQNAAYLEKQPPLLAIVLDLF